jgi:membrane AbrB-like protein
MPRRAAGPAARWALLALAVAGVGKVLGLAGVPTPLLFAGFVVGIAYALCVPVRMETPRAAVVAGQAIVGVAVGAYLERSTLVTVGSHWAAVLLVTVVTLAISIGCGVWLARLAPLDLATSSFGMIAGGAAGIISISRDLGADERIVAVLQYVRVLIIVALTPIVATAVFHITPSPARAGPGSSTAAALLFLAACAGLGVPFARLVRLPAGALLGPMLAAAAFQLGGSGFAAAVPGRVLDVAFALIGLEVGLRFTAATVRQAGAILWIVVLMVLGIIAVCALLGVLLASLADVSELDGYLATTPGGLSAVVALAVGSKTNATFVLSVQLVRTFVMLLGAPILARWIAQRGPAASTPDAT